MRKPLVGIIFGWFFSFVLGFLGGMAQLTHDVATDCERDMRVAVNGTEYTCMKVPENGLAQNMEQLVGEHQLAQWSKEVYEENKLQKSNKELQGDAKWCNIQSTGVVCQWSQVVHRVG